MTQTEWATKEVADACKRENPNWDGVSFDYGCSCYQSALKAYKSLMEDNHSGFSFGITKHILERLMEGLPLSKITEEDFEGLDFSSYDSIQCPRMSSLFKHRNSDGTIYYTDVDRCYCIDIHDENNTFTGGERKIIDKLFPIKLPYWPIIGKYKVYVEEFLSDIKNGDYDTSGYLYCITPDGKKIEINKYFTEKDGKMVEISKEEYLKRKSKKIH